MGLAGYDAWKTFDAAGERAAELHEAIIEEPELYVLQRRCELQEGRCAALTRALLTAAPLRKRRVGKILQRASAIAIERANRLQAAIEDFAEDGR